MRGGWVSLLTTSEMGNLTRPTRSFGLPPFLLLWLRVVLALGSILAFDTNASSSGDTWHAIGFLRVAVVGGV